MKANNGWDLTTGNTAKHDSLREVLIKIALVLKSALHGAKKDSVTKPKLIKRQVFEKGLSQLVFGYLAEDDTHQAAGGSENGAAGSGGSASTQGSSAAANNHATLTIDSRHLLLYSAALAGFPPLLTNPSFRGMMANTTFFVHNASTSTSIETLGGIKGSIQRVEDMAARTRKRVGFLFLNNGCWRFLLAYLSTPEILALASTSGGSLVTSKDGADGGASQASCRGSSVASRGTTFGGGSKRSKTGNGSGSSSVSSGNRLTRR